MAFPDSAWALGGMLYTIKSSPEQVNEDWHIDSFLRACRIERKELKSNSFDFAGAVWNLFASFDLKNADSLFGINVLERSSSDAVFDCYCKFDFEDISMRKLKKIIFKFKRDSAQSHCLVDDFFSKSELDEFLQRGYRICCYITVEKLSRKEACSQTEITCSYSTSTKETHTQTEAIENYSKTFPDSKCPLVVRFFPLLPSKKVEVSWDLTMFLGECCGRRKEIKSDEFSFAGAKWYLFTYLDQEEDHSLFQINVRENRPLDIALDCHCKIDFKTYNLVTLNIIEFNFKCENADSHMTVENFLTNSQIDFCLQDGLLVTCLITIQNYSVNKEACPQLEIADFSSTGEERAYTENPLLQSYSKTSSDSGGTGGGDGFYFWSPSPKHVEVNWLIESFLRECLRDRKELQSDHFTFAGATWNFRISLDWRNGHSVFEITVQECKILEAVLDCYCNIYFYNSFGSVIKKIECEFTRKSADSHSAMEDFLSNSEMDTFLQQGFRAVCLISIKNTSMMEACPRDEMTNSSRSNIMQARNTQPLQNNSVALEDTTWPCGGDFLQFPYISKETVYIAWNIKSFIRECWGGRKEIRSVNFDFADASWSLLTTFDQTQVHSMFGINIQEQKTSNTSLDCHCTIFFDDYNNLTVKTIKNNFKCKSGVWVIENFLSSSEYDAFLQRVYRIFCVLKVKKSNIKEACVGEEITGLTNCISEEVYSKTEKENAELLMDYTESKVLKDFKNLFLSGKGSDVTIQVQGHQFKAHRLILMTRSPTFAYIFQQDTQDTGVLHVEDCEPSSFQILLEFIYCGSTEKLSTENVFSLYSSANKYDVEDLKMKCLQFIRSNLAVNTFCRTLRLSLELSETNLIKLATEFFIRNFQQIIGTTEWQTFHSENPIQGNELFVKAAENISIAPFT